MVKVVLATPSLQGPTKPFVASLAASAKLIEAAGFECSFVQELGNPYISGARATMLRKALDSAADIVVFIDYDLSWEPENLVTLIQTQGDVVSGTYRFKKAEEEYMGAWETDGAGRPVVREDGAFKGTRVPGGFLKITKEGVDKFMSAYPELIYGPRYNASVDLFNHGVIDGVWYGEDYAFSKRWRERCGDIWIIPDMDINHHSADEAFVGNLHEFMMRQPGGSKEGQ